MPGFTSIHRRRDFDDVGQATMTEMVASLHQFHAMCELLEVEAFVRPERMPAKERNHHIEEIPPPAHDVAV